MLPSVIGSPVGYLVAIAIIDFRDRQTVLPFGRDADADLKFRQS